MPRPSKTLVSSALHGKQTYIHTPPNPPQPPNRAISTRGGSTFPPSANRLGASLRTLSTQALCALFACLFAALQNGTDSWLGCHGGEGSGYPEAICRGARALVGGQIWPRVQPSGPPREGPRSELTLPPPHHTPASKPAPCTFSTMRTSLFLKTSTARLIPHLLLQILGKYEKKASKRLKVRSLRSAAGGGHSGGAGVAGLELGDTLALHL